MRPPRQGKFKTIKTEGVELTGAARERAIANHIKWLKRPPDSQELDYEGSPIAEWIKKNAMWDRYAKVGRSDTEEGVCRLDE